MSDGIDLLTAILETGSTKSIREISDDLFMDDELPLYAGITNHFRRYGRLPAIETMEDGLGVRLPEIRENVDYYLHKVLDRKLYGAVHDEFANLRESLRSFNMEGARAAITAMSSAANSTQRAGGGSIVNLRSAFEQMVEEYDESHRNPGMTGIPSGFPTFDEKTGGYQNGDLYSWVARLGVGKTNILLKQADQSRMEGHNTLVVTTEMPVPQMVRRLAGIQSGIDPDLIRKGMLSTWTRRRLGRLVDSMVNSERFHLYAAGMNQPVGTIGALVNELSPDIVYIDGAYLLRPDTKKFLSKLERVPEVFDALRSLALTSDRPFVTTTQFSRQSGKRGKEGSIESIAFSDAIAMNSSVVVAIKEGKPPFQHTRRIFEIMKGRDGETGEVTINYQFRPVNMAEMDPEEVQAESVDLDWMSNA